MKDLQMPDFLYHGTTTARMAGIMESGLVPQNCQDDVKRGHSDETRLGIYFASDHLSAGEYSSLAEDRWGGEPLTLAVRVATLDESLLEPDDYDLADALADLTHPRSVAGIGAVTGTPLRAALAGYGDWRSVPWQLSLSTVGQVMYIGQVAPADVFVLEYPGWPQDPTPTIVPVRSSRWLETEMDRMADPCRDGAGRTPGR